jgi:glycerophosphoryl diester phosphodiesterase
MVLNFRGRDFRMAWRLSACLCLWGAAAAAETASPHPFFAEPAMLGAHRGGADLWPENTLLAYTECAKRWPEILLEADVYRTADGEIVVIHDATVNRTTNGEGAIAEMTLAEIQALDAGYRFTTDGGQTFPYRGKGLTIPTLREVLEATREHRILVETKDGEGVAEATLEIIRAAGAEDRVLLASFKPAHMAYFREAAPAIARCFDFQTGGALMNALRSDGWDAYEPADHCLSVMKRMQAQFNLTAEELRRIKNKGVVVQIHTVNDKDGMTAFLDLGFESILTDNPELLASVISEQNENTDEGRATE